MRPDVLHRVVGKVAFIARVLEEVATALDNEELEPDDRRRIDGALRRGQHEVDIISSVLSSLESAEPEIIL